MMPLDMVPADHFVLRGGQCLVPGEGLAALDIRIAGGRIAELAPAIRDVPAAVIDAQGLLVLPGIVDVHGDAFERKIMPRPKTVFPLKSALIDTDRQLAANGITTAFHGVTVSWEPGLRSLQEAERIIAALDACEDGFLVDHRLHIRWETFAFDEMASVTALFGRPKKPLLAFNDHTGPSLAGGRQETKIRGAADRAMVDAETYRALLSTMASRAPDVPRAVKQMAEAARLKDIKMLSHDDADAGMRRAFRGLGAGIAEFPLSWEAAEEAAAGGDDIVLGAPNVMRGGSHNGAIGAESAIARGLCTMLASDYYYPAPLHAAFRLWRCGALPLERAWGLVSHRPAAAAGLHDRGMVAPGTRADLVLVEPERPSVVGTLVRGRPVLWTSVPR